LIAGVGGEVNKSDASALFRFREPHYLCRDFNALTGVRQLKANARQVFTYGKAAGYSNSHARLTYIEDDAAVGATEVDKCQRKRSGALLKAAVTRRS